MTTNQTSELKSAEEWVDEFPMAWPHVGRQLVDEKTIRRIQANALRFAAGHLRRCCNPPDCPCDRCQLNRTHASWIEDQATQLEAKEGK